MDTHNHLDHEMLSFAFREYHNLYNRVVYRGDQSIDCSTTKCHSILHLAEAVREYGSPIMNHEAGKGERGLKKWAKLVAVTAQKKGIQEFTDSTAMKIYHWQLLSNAMEDTNTIPQKQLSHVYPDDLNDSPFQ